MHSYFTLMKKIKFETDTQLAIDMAYHRSKARMGSLQPQITRDLLGYSIPEQQIMRFYYGYMPTEDIFAVDFNTLIGFARHAVFLKENVQVCKEMPDDLFLNYVAWYRVNNEAITDCRHRFFNSITENEKNIAQNMEEAVLNTNYWCLSKATYQTTDERTIAPEKMLECGYGRCGEESTFTVTALRSVGIPARQVYAPHWSHCDDNHAWVEAWIDGKWHYMGACEPEPVLDKGWFTAAASRAMIINTKSCSDLYSTDEMIAKEGNEFILNRTSNYADTEKFTICVKKDSIPVEGVTINLQVLNYSDYCTVAQITTNRDGEASITMGLGFIAVHAKKDGKFVFSKLDTRETHHLDIDFSNASKQQNPNVNGELFVAHPPKENVPKQTPLTIDEKRKAREKFDFYQQKRLESVKKFSSPAVLKLRQNEIGILPGNSYIEETTDMLRDSLGSPNGLKLCLERAKEYGNIELRVKVLEALSKKDRIDINDVNFESHLKESLTYFKDYPEDIFVKYVANPRIDMENITFWRAPILNLLSETQKKTFHKNPSLIWDWCNNFHEEDSPYKYSQVLVAPEILSYIERGSRRSINMFVVAVCRTIGLAARISPQTGLPEYYDGQKFIRIENSSEPLKDSKLVLTSKENTKWSYSQNWGLSILRNGDYEKFDLSDANWDNNTLKLKIPQGEYRLVTSNRMPTGSIFAIEYHFKTSVESETVLDIALTKTKLSDLLSDIELPRFKILDEQMSEIGSEVMLAKDTIVIFAEDAKEPTEHILNELMELKERYNKSGWIISLVLRGEEALIDYTIAKAMGCLENVRVYYDDFTDNLQLLGRRTYCDPDKLPLVMAVNGSGEAIYACSGYNVGMGELLLKIMEI